MPPTACSLRTRSAVCLAAVAVLGIGICRDAWPWIADDAFISLRYADRLLAGHGLTWTDGERVEGYSNLLWVLLSTGLGALGCDWITAVRGLGIACTIATFAILSFGGLLPARMPALLAVVLLAAQAAVSTWAIGGLEVPLVMLLLAAAMTEVQRALRNPEDPRRRNLLGAGIALALLAWTRPDGPLWAVVAGIATLVGVGVSSRGTPRRWLGALAPLLLPAIVAVLLQLLFRLAYYGDWVPNTAHAKVSPSSDSRDAGMQYLASSATALRALLVPAGIGFVLAIRHREQRAMLTFALLGVGLWCLYLMEVGGDVFPRSRLALPAAVPLTVLAASGLTSLGGYGRRGRVAAWLLAIGSIALARIDAELPTTDVRQQLSTWEWRGVEAGEWLGRAFGDCGTSAAHGPSSPPLLAVDAAGAVPFTSRLPCLDMLGLCDRAIAATPLAADRAFLTGHNRGNGDYVLRRLPDLVMFGEPPGTPQPRFSSGAQMEADPRFLADYRVVLFDTGAPHNLRLTTWVRLIGRIGVDIDSRRGAIHVPGYLLASYRQPYSFASRIKDTDPGDTGHAVLQRDLAAGARWWLDADVVGVLDTTQGVVGQIRRHGRHVVSAIPVPPGGYSLVAETLPVGLAVQLADARGAELPRANGAWVVAGEESAVAVDIVCVVPPHLELPITIHRIGLQRRD